MSAFDIRDEKSIAANHCSDRPTYIGTDEDGGVHYWSIHDRRVIVVEDGETETADHVTVDDRDLPLADLKRPLAHWHNYTAAERGWVDCQITDDDALVGGL